jgi:formylglycine-generating enzyme required for sulfatase activity
MGSANGDPDERPVHRVRISRGFWMQKTEVTQEQWRRVMGNKPSHFQACGETCPVERISWDDARLFAERLNEEGSGGRFRLPTEAEWEYAARAGTRGAYGGSGVMEEMGWYQANAAAQPHPVGQKTANAWGLHDMHGNVWEWVSDWYSESYYVESPAVDPTGPSSGQARVSRGGSWSGGALLARSSYRSSDAPSVRTRYLGFRLIREP